MIAITSSTVSNSPAASCSRPPWRRVGWWMVLFLMCCAWDRAVWLVITRDDVPRLGRLETLIEPGTFVATLRDAAHLKVGAIADAAIAVVYGAMYLFGRLWPWIALAVVFIFRHWGGADGRKVRLGLRRGVFVVLVPALAGLAAEALKVLSRRLRPEDHSGFYAFKPWARATADGGGNAPGVLSGEFWSTSRIGLASSHAAVALGGALAAGLLLPRWRVPLLIAAVLCSLSRVAVGAHFLSDVCAGAAIGCALYAVVYAWDRRNNGGQGIDAAG